MTIPTATDSYQRRILSIGSHDGIDLSNFDAFQSRIPLHGYVVYVIRRDDGHALYVGQTRHPRTRLRTHWRRKPWWPEVAALDLYGADDEVSARHLEHKLHGRLRPLHSQVTEHEADRLRVLTQGGAQPAHVRPDRPTRGGGMYKYGEPTVAFRVSVLTDTRLSILARLVNAWLCSIKDDSVPPAAATASTLGCTEEDVRGAYAELLSVGVLSPTDEDNNGVED